jgi:ferritin-like protein
MTGASAGLHEDADKLKRGTIDRHRAIVSLMEELEAVDWYDQRIDAAEDDELRAILVHNRDEEKEHASMLLEWLRRRDAAFDHELETYLFTEGEIMQCGTAGEVVDSGSPASDLSLGIGSLKEGNA